jgi:oligoendopeptidase F
MAEKKRTPNFHAGGEKGTLHREMGVPEGQKIPAEKLKAATHSKDREERDDASRAETMRAWSHKGKGASG